MYVCDFGYQDEKYRLFCEYANQSDCLEALQNYTSPIDSSIILGKLM